MNDVAKRKQGGQSMVEVQRVTADPEDEDEDDDTHTPLYTECTCPAHMLGSGQHVEGCPMRKP